MKGVVLSGGTGSRLRPITFSMAKQLVPVANKPILFYGLSDLVTAGITDVAIVVSPETGSDVRRAVGDGAHFGFDEVEYIVQDEPLGLAHALNCALPWVDGDDVLMYLGDNLLRHGVRDIVNDFEMERPNCQILLTSVDDPTQFGVADLDGGKVVRLEEKPAVPASNMALVGVYLFDSTVGQALTSIQPSGRGEYEITDAIQYLIDQGHEVKYSEVQGWWKDTGKKEDLLHANELVLDHIETLIDGDVTNTTIDGLVRIEPGAKVNDSSITGPVVIGAGTRIQGTEIGPNTAIGSNCRIEGAIVSETIVMDDASISGWSIRRSLIGHETIVGGPAPSHPVELTLGERSEIGNP